jgi:hypothetical protein
MPDMREILQIAKADPPPARYTVDDIVVAGQRRRRRALAHRIGGAGVLATAVVTAGVLVAVNLALPGGRGVQMPVVPAQNPPAPKAAEPWPPFTFTFGAYQVDNYRVLAPDEVSLDSQVAVVVRDGTDGNGKPLSRAVGTLTVYQPGKYNSEPASADGRVAAPRTKVTVQGREAFQWEFSTKMPVAPSPTGQTPRFEQQDFVRTVLAWQWAPGAWATLVSEANRYETSGTFPFADEVKVAERFVTGTPTPAKAPFRTGYLPAGFTLQSVSGQALPTEQRGMVTLVYAKSPYTGSKTAPSVVISILEKDDPPPDAIKRTSRCNAGQHFCITDLPDGRFWFATEDPSETLSDAELLRIADGLTLATITDSTTWYDAG